AIPPRTAEPPACRRSWGWKTGWPRARPNMPVLSCAQHNELKSRNLHSPVTWERYGARRAESRPTTTDQTGDHQMNRFMKIAVAGAVTAATAAASAHDYGRIHHRPRLDFGQRIEALTRLESLELFGFFAPLADSSTLSLSATEAEANAARLLTVAPGLRVRVLSAAANLAPNIDQMFLFPAKHPTHIIACNEQGSGQVGVQRINIKTGVAETIISSGLSSCDPARVTPWGTVIVGEENGTNGRLFEILDPLNTNNVTVPASGFGASSDPAHVVARPALGQFSFEGIGILP